MDIVQLLEVLKPLNNVVTIQVVNDTQMWDEIGKFVIAIAPFVVSIAALGFSYWQFKKNIKYQNDQFSLSIKQQLKALKLNTQLATEIELKKDLCKEIRGAYIAFYKHHSEYYTSQVAYRLVKDAKTPEDKKKRADLHEVVLEKGQLCLDSKMLLETYLDLSDEEDMGFYDICNKVGAMSFKAECTAIELGRVQGECALHFFRLIKRKNNEIISLVDTITDD